MTSKANRLLAGKAVTYKALAGPEVIEIVERTVRAPAAGDVHIEVKAAGVNPTDILFRDPAQAQHIVVPASSVVPIPEGVSLAGAAALPMNGLTALRAVELAALERGRSWP